MGILHNINEISYCVICGNKISDYRISQGKKTCCASCQNRTPEARQKRSESLKKSWENKEVLQKRANSIKERQRFRLSEKLKHNISNCIICGKKLTESQIYRNKKVCSVSCAMKNYYRNLTEEKKEELRHKNSLAVRKAYENPEVRQKISKIQKDCWSKDDGSRRLKASKVFSDTLKDLWTDEDYRKSISSRLKDKMTEKWKDSDYREHQRISHSKVWENEEFKKFHKKRTSEGVKKAYENPEVRQNLSDSIKRAYSERHDEIQQKIHDTKKKNHSFNLSLPEQQIKQLLEKKFKNVQYQYRSDKYPFYSDFYIEDLDLYIEYNGTWSHGLKPYDENDEECRARLEKWQEKAKTSKYYQKAIYTWTDLDVRKLNTFKKNNLNYKIFYSLDDLVQWISNN